MKIKTIDKVLTSKKLDDAGKIKIKNAYIDTQKVA